MLVVFRSIGVSNFNVHHLEGLKKACPDHIPAGISIDTGSTVIEDCFEIISQSD